MPAEQALAKPIRAETRFRPDEKKLVKYAAKALGVSESHFINESALLRAREVVLDLREQGTIVLGERDSQIFIENLLNPPAPSEEFLAAFKRYKSMVNSEK